MSKGIIITAGVIVVGAFGAVRIADAMSGGTEAPATQTSAVSSSKTAASSSSVHATVSSSSSSSEKEATTANTAASAETATPSTDDMIAAIATKYQLGTNTSYTWAILDQGATYQIEARVPSPAGDATNLQGIYRYDTATGAITQLNYLTGDYE
jgi:hypothetical protein